MSAAARVFDRRGLYGATVREIVGEAGLTAPALYYHFDGKEDVYAKLIQVVGERFRSLVTEVAAAEADPYRRLSAIAQACIRFAEEDRTRLRVFYAELFRPGAHEEDEFGLGDLRAWTRAQVESVLRDLSRANGVRVEDPGGASRLFVALLSGLLVEQAQRPASALLDEGLADDVVRVFLWGVDGGKEKR